MKLKYKMGVFLANPV